LEVVAGCGVEGVNDEELVILEEIFAGDEEESGEVMLTTDVGVDVDPDDVVISAVPEEVAVYGPWNGAILSRLGKIKFYELATLYHPQAS
jgi:hypothetical protein